MWSLLFCISRTSILSACMAARTAFHRRCSSVVEIGVFRRSLRAAMGGPFLPECGATKYGRPCGVNQGQPTYGVIARASGQSSEHSGCRAVLDHPLLSAVARRAKADGRARTQTKEREG